MLYLNLAPGRQRSLLKEAKLHLGYTWEQFASFLNVNRSMIFFYLNETSRLPSAHYHAICEKRAVHPENLPTVRITNKSKTIHFPLFSEKLAELLGIIAGDGYLGRDAYELSIALDKTSDKDYVNHVLLLIEELFKTKPLLYYQNNVARVKVYSKALFYYLKQYCGLVSGDKMNKLRVPLRVWSERRYMRAFLRGVFDTDGSFHRHRLTDACAEFTSADARFLQELVDALLFLGIRTTSSGNNAYIYSREHIHRFFARIRPANPKHIRKYRHFCDRGFVLLKNQPIPERYI